MVGLHPKVDTANTRQSISNDSVLLLSRAYNTSPRSRSAGTILDTALLCGLSVPASHCERILLSLVISFVPMFRWESVVGARGKAARTSTETAPCASGRRRAAKKRGYALGYHQSPPSRIGRTTPGLLCRPTRRTRSRPRDPSREQSSKVSAAAFHGVRPKVGHVAIA